MENTLKSIDWNHVLYDRMSRQYLSYSEMVYKSKYQISIPFYYPKEDFIHMKEQAYGANIHKYKPLSIGADKSDAGKLLKDNVWESLPSGFVSGQNLGNLLSSLTVGYQDEMEFINLPVPYICVAADMVSFKPKVWYSGHLPTAMRSTMSIPALFAPVKVDGMVLVDGGIRDNYPVLLARELGADIIIGVELSDRRKISQEVNNLGDLAGQVVDLLIADNLELSKDAADIKIKPDLTGYGTMSFSAESIDTIIQRGYDAAKSQDSLLMQAKARIGELGHHLSARPAVDLANKRIWISSVEIKGISEREKEVLRKKITIQMGQFFTKTDVDEMIQQIYGTKCFDYVTYEIHGTSEPYKLVINCVKGPVHQVSVGGRLDTEEIIAANIDVGLNAHKLMGSKYDFQARISANPSFKFHYIYDAPKIPTLNATAYVKWSDLSKLDFGQSKLSVCSFNARADAYLSNIQLMDFDFQAGLRNDYFRMGANSLDTAIDAAKFDDSYDLEQINNDYLTLLGSIVSETFDSAYFPTKGFSLGGSYGWTFKGWGPGSFTPFHTASLHAKVVISDPKKFFAFVPSVNARFLFGDKIPAPFFNLMGGSLAGRYYDQQMPFMGVNYAMGTDKLLTVFRTDFRFKVATNHYVTAVANYALHSDTIRNYFNKDGYLGVGVEYAYNTIIGPIGANVHWSTVTNKPGFYISIGFDF